MDPQVARVLEILQAAPGTAGANTREMITCCIELRNKRKLIEQARAKDNPRAQELADKWEREFEAKTKVYRRLVGARFGPEKIEEQLWGACMRGDADWVQMTIECEAPLMCPLPEDSASWTNHPLLLASLYGKSTECVELLLAAKEPWVDDADRNQQFLAIFVAAQQEFSASNECVQLVLQSFARFKREGETVSPCGGRPRLDADAELVGYSVRIHGLKTRRELNGRVGRALQFDSQKCRYAVQLDYACGEGKDENLMVRPANLCPNMQPYAAKPKECAPTKKAEPSPEEVEQARAEFLEMKMRHDAHEAAKAAERKDEEVKKRERVAAERAARAAQPNKPLSASGPSAITQGDDGRIQAPANLGGQGQARSG